MYFRLWLRHWSPLHLHLVQVRQLRLRDGVSQREEVGDGPGHGASTSQEETAVVRPEYCQLKH